jgi:hypothetical protein
MKKYADRCKQTTTTTGPDTFLLGPKVSKMRVFAAEGALSVGDQLYYCAEHTDPNIDEWEIGEGTLVDATHISRDNVLSSSNNNDIVNFSAGIKHVFSTLPASAAMALASPNALSVTAVADPTAAYLPLRIGTQMSQISITNLLTSVGSSDAQLSNAGALGDGDILVVTQDGANAVRTSLAALKAYVGGAVAPTPTVTSVTVSPATASLQGGGAQTFTAAVAGTNSPAQTVTWTASAGTITAGGVFTAPAATASTQTITITARSTVDTTKTGTATVTVAAASAPAPTVSSVTVAPATANVAGGTTQQFTATVNGTNSPSQGVTWSTTAGAISSAGVFTAPAATSSAQTITITATSTQDGTKSGTATATVAAATPAAATGVTMTGPTGGAVSTASSDFTVGVTPVGGTIAAPVTVTLTDNGGGGTFTPATVTLTSAAPTATFKYTASATAGARTISATNDGGLTNPSSITYTSTAPNVAYTITGYGGNSIKTSLTAADASYSGGTYGSKLGFTNAKFSTLASNQQYWKVVRSSDGTTKPASAVSGWSSSSTVPPAIIPQSGTGGNTNAAASQNGATPMTIAAAACANNAILWADAGTGTQTFFFWIKPVDGDWFCVNANAGLAVAT